MSYSFASIPSKMLIVDKFSISDGIVFHITGPEYDELFLNKLMFGWGYKKIDSKQIVTTCQVMNPLVPEKDL